MKKLRLLAIIEASSLTGPAKNLLQFAEYARSRAADPAVETAIAVFERAPCASVFIERAAELCVPVHVIPEAGRFDRAVLGRLRAVARKLAPDLIQSHAVKSHFLVRVSGLRDVAPWIAFHHGYTWPDMRMRLYNQLDRWSLRAPDLVVTVAECFRQELIRKGAAARNRPLTVAARDSAPRVARAASRDRKGAVDFGGIADEPRVEVVHNAVSPDWGARFSEPQACTALRQRLGIAAGAKVALIVGRLSREKDHATVLEAMRRLKKETPGGGPHLVIVGDGPERFNIERAARSLGVAVTITGQVPSAEPFYGIADVAVLSSLSEGCPNALLEAMAARVPVVATAVGGVPEIVANGEAALLIAPRNPEAMSAAICAILSDELLAGRLADRAQKLVEAHYTPEARGRRLVEIYSRLAG